MKKGIVLVLMALGNFAFAAGDAGCGLGSLIISKNSKLLQLFAMTTNSVLLTQPLGITSGTSGCSSSGLVSNEKQMQYFVEINNDDLSRQMARGEGEKLEVLALLSGCQDAEAQKQFSAMTKASYNQIYSSSDVKPEDVIANLKAQIKNNADVQRTCQLASL